MLCPSSAGAGSSPPGCTGAGRRGAAGPPGGLPSCPGRVPGGAQQLVQKSAEHLSLIGVPAALGLWGDRRAACTAAWQLLRLHRLPHVIQVCQPPPWHCACFPSRMVLAGTDCAPAV